MDNWENFIENEYVVLEIKDFIKKIKECDFYIRYGYLSKGSLTPYIAKIKYAIETSSDTLLALQPKGMDIIKYIPVSEINLAIFKEDNCLISFKKGE